MCGISCIIALQQSRHDSDPPNHVKAVNGVLTNGHGTHEHSPETKLANELDASLDQIQHRGPDSRGQWISKDKRVGPLILTYPCLYSFPPKLCTNAT
jgi:asparagine synthase (glutamine-hydrolysing)